METTIDIPEELLQETMRHTHAATQREAVVAAMESYNQSRRMAELIGMMGKSETFMTLEELMAMREAEMQELP